MKCELCHSREMVEAVDSPTIPWTKIAMCEVCLEEYRNGREIEAIVRKIQ